MSEEEKLALFKLLFDRILLDKIKSENYVKAGSDFGGAAHNNVGVQLKREGALLDEVRSFVDNYFKKIPLPLNV